MKSILSKKNKTLKLFVLIMVLARMIMYVSLKLTVVAVVPMLLIIVGDIFFGKAMHRRFLARQEAFSNLTDHVQETISGTDCSASSILRS